MWPQNKRCSLGVSGWRPGLSSSTLASPSPFSVDMAGDTPAQVLDEAIDAALSSHLVTLEALSAEATRLKRRGRRGPSELRDQLRHRACNVAPAPSVLESRALRLLAANDAAVLGCEVVIYGGTYRLDMQLSDRLFIELDGYAYHWSPESKRYDDTRRNKIRLLGIEVLVYDWQVLSQGTNRMLQEVRAALAGARTG